MVSDVNMIAVLLLFCCLCCHIYKVWDCVLFFTDEEDLCSNCPGDTAADHD